MENPATDRKPSEARTERPGLCRVISLCGAVLLFLTAVPVMTYTQVLSQSKTPSAEPIPEPAVAAILAAFDKYEVVAMPEAHGNKDIDDFIFSLIRNPTFSDKVNDIEVECGNSLYQPALDHYIAGEDISFTEVRKVWRNTTQAMCGMSGFFEQFFSLVRAINQKLPPTRRLRVLAGDPPIDWEQVKSFQDTLKFVDRDASIATVMEKEVLSKHRKALMLFGTHHLMHGEEGNAVSSYEKNYPGLTFVISDLGYFDTNAPTLSGSRFVNWPVPSLARAKGTWLGALELSNFLPPGIMIDKDCKAHTDFPKPLQGPSEHLIDAFLYLGPQDLRLVEQRPADIALDVDYRMEVWRRESLPGSPWPPPPGTLKEANQQIIAGAEHPIFVIPKMQPTPQMIKDIEQSCLDSKSHSSPPQ